MRSFGSNCIALAFVLASAMVVEPASAKSDWIDELREGCSKGDGQACTNLGGQLELGMFAPADLPGARRAYEMGCKDDFASLGSCVQLYRMLSLGEGGPKDLVRAAKLESKACGTEILIYQVELERRGLCKK